jgi:hypothetical protein
MDAKSAGRALESYRGDVEPSADSVARYRAALESVGRRPAGLDQKDVVRDLPPILNKHAERLRELPSAAPYFSEGWTVQLADLKRVCAFQPQVFIDSAERMARVKSADLEEVAQISLPAESRSQTFEPTFDSQRNAWSISSPNPNLRVVGTLGGPLQNAPHGSISVGFFVAVLPSFMQVARFQGRYFLRDGYHRAIGLLMAGISQVPVFVTDISEIERLVPAGMLPQAAFLGPRPPTLPDYLDDSVSAAVQAPATQKLILVQALELNV